MDLSLKEMHKLKDNIEEEWAPKMKSLAERSGLRFKRKGPKPHYPPLAINDPEHNRQQKAFAFNLNYTTKYTFISFVPKLLLEQFQKTTNFYFLLVVIITLIPSISPVSPITTLPGLLFVLALAALREAYEDLNRYKEDTKVNNKLIRTVESSTGQQVDKKSSRLRVGDLVYLSNNSTVPADVILLISSLPDGQCYIETSQLDGETNLKLRKAPVVTASMSVEEIANLKGFLQCEPPTHHLYGFQGNITLANSETPSPLSDENLLLRGVSIRNTEWAVGIVVYCGEDTKLALNSKKPPSKLSSLDILLNKVVIGLLVFKVMICVICTVLDAQWEKNRVIEHWYIGPDSNDSPEVIALKTFFSYFAIFSYLIPQSLVISLEIAKFVQSQLMQWDEEMVGSKNDLENTSMKAKTSNLNDELGLVKYIFSDKTGTLTENRMEFSCCSIDGRIYTDEALRSVLQERQSRYLDKVEDFVFCMAACHSVIAGKNEGSDEVIYRAASPDEEALCNAARSYGFVFIGRNNEGITLEIRGKQVVLPVLCLLEFTSERRRMSIIIRNQEGKIMMYSKGADSVMYERLREGQEDVKRKTDEDMELFSKDGLRTLVLGKKELTEDQFRVFNDAYQAAAASIGDRDEKVEEVTSQFESAFSLIGATAIEDKLQQNVPETIDNLLKAGISVWIITGDKQATAINIGYLCRLLGPEMHVEILNADSAEQCKARLEQTLAQFEGRDDVADDLALVIDGKTLKFAISDYPNLFVRLSQLCHAVVCCRVTPLQKAQVVRLIRESGPWVTLSIGDGANDVSMIQEAHIGVGIFGNEGTQAARAADFAIHQFSHLYRLILVHGRYSVIRNTLLISYSFYKNAAIFLCQLWFSIYSGFSARTVYNDFMMTFFNILLTSAPPAFSGFFEKDLDERILLWHPELFPNVKNLLFGYSALFRWMLLAIAHSLVIFFGSYLTLKEGNINSDGKSVGLFVYGNATLSAGLLLAYLKLFTEVKHWTWIIHLGIWGSVVCYFICFSTISYMLEYVPDQYNQFIMTFSSLSVWGWIALCTCGCFIFELLYYHVQRNFFPWDWQIMQEMYSTAKRDDMKKMRITGKKSYLRATLRESMKKAIPKKESEDSFDNLSVHSDNSLTIGLLSGKDVNNSIHIS